MVSMHHPPEFIVGTSIRLRRSLPADAQAVYLACADEDVMRFMEWPAHESVDGAIAYMNGCADRWAQGTEYHWVIEDLHGGPLLGCIACRIKGHAADFGYFLDKAAWGKGFATEAATLLMAWLAEEPSVLRIWASTDVENIKSAHLLERVGMQREAVLRMATYRPNIGGLPRDTVIYALCKRDP